MSNDDDRLVERAGDDGREVRELDAADAGNVLLPAVLPDGRARRARASRGTTRRRVAAPGEPGTRFGFRLASSVVSAAAAAASNEGGSVGAGSGPERFE